LGTPTAGSIGSEARAPFPTPDGWREYADWRGAPGSVVGRLLVHPDVASPGLGNRRAVFVLVPPSLDALGVAGSRAPRAARRRYPVVYMHDGQNLFDEEISGYGEWRVDETMADLGTEGIEAIVVGIPNAEMARPIGAQQRPDEYSPYAGDGFVGNAEDYLSFIADVVKPLVDDAFPTDPAPAATGIAGSSLGGLASLYGLVARPDTFGFGGLVSPALSWAGGRPLREIAPALRPAAGRRVYVDVGGHEGAWDPSHARGEEISRRYLADARALRDTLLGNGFVEGADLRYVEAPDDRHHEAAWSARAPGMFRFLLGET
jgi:predicted alpha/beta superfamily hydrolase